MLHGIFKQHQVHGWMNLIVVFQGICEDGTERSPVCDRSIGGFLTHLGKVAKKEGLLFHLYVIQSLEENRHNNVSFGLSCYVNVRRRSLFHL